MSYTQRLAGYSYGISNYLRKQGFDVSGSGKKLNDILISFLKYKGLGYRPWKANQKDSLKTADMWNAEIISLEYWDEFKDWSKTKAK